MKVIPYVTSPLIPRLAAEINPLAARVVRNPQQYSPTIDQPYNSV